MYLRNCPQSNDDKKLPGKLVIISPCFIPKQRTRTETVWAQKTPPQKRCAFAAKVPQSISRNFSKEKWAALSLVLNTPFRTPKPEQLCQKNWAAFPVLYTQKLRSRMTKKCFLEIGQRFTLFSHQNREQKTGNRLGPKILPKMVRIGSKSTAVDLMEHLEDKKIGQHFSPCFEH